MQILLIISNNKCKYVKVIYNAVVCVFCFKQQHYRPFISAHNLEMSVTHV